MEFNDEIFKIMAMISEFESANWILPPSTSL